MTSAPTHASIFESFLTELAKSFESRNVPDFVDLFLPAGYFRDVLISHWGYASISKDSLDKFFQIYGGLPNIVPRSIKVDPKKTLPLFNEGVNWIQGFFRV
ncbi:uncharacterized protein EI90DRAFT_3101798 [Cantharellus anzutake]|uniref:uncharacterized protein n=1 Tax=Cantharellus anzutake TaxID=1750568 RepID=UPI0019056550|nr:uncharacterized protein EI90DRAFT_3101798 [Cantharellus anzutake]KAF8310238.1 hypothetical protein EI90DRAFT_3101798 [Cantharellus anzutake]